jgi:hypothetical protein
MGFIPGRMGAAGPTSRAIVDNKEPTPTLVPGILNSGADPGKGASGGRCSGAGGDALRSINRSARRAGRRSDFPSNTSQIVAITSLCRAGALEERDPGGQ